MSIAKKNATMMSRDQDCKVDVEEEPDKGGGYVKVDSFEEFSGYTTLHGIRFIADHTSILPRRVFWVLLVLLCGSLFGVQMHDRIVYYLSSPVNVNIKVNYPDKASFPAVTICNQNNFRISKAFEGDWLEFIYGYYNNEVDAMSKLSEEHLNASVADLFVGLAHAKEDLIVKCKWANEDCSAENFTTTLTSHGVCFTFNQVERPQDSLIVHASGVEHALRLTLNTENYEGLKGPHDMTGIKMMVTDQSKVPRVEEVGLAISTGIHALVGVSELTIHNRVILQEKNEYLRDSPSRAKAMPVLARTRRTVQLIEREYLEYSRRQVRGVFNKSWKYPIIYVVYGPISIIFRQSLELSNLPPPYGECGEVPLLSTDRYTTDACLMECETQYTYNTCGCRHFYMPDLTGEMGVCSIKQFLTCLQQTQGDTRIVRNPILAEITSLERSNTSGYFAAKEFSSKADYQQRDVFNASLTNAITSVDSLSKTIGTNRDYAKEHDKLMLEFSTQIKSVIGRLKEIYDFMMIVIKENLIRGSEEMEEDTFRFICQDHRGFVRQVLDQITQLVANNKDDTSVAKVMYLNLQISLTNKQETIKRALDNYTQLVDAYTQKDILLNYTTKDVPLEFWIALKPRKVLRIMAYLDPFLKQQDILDIADAVSNIEAYVAELFQTKLTTTDANRIQTLNNNFQNACESFLLKKIQFYSVYIDLPVIMMGEKIDKFDNMVVEFNTVEEKLNNTIVNYNKSINEARNYKIPFLLESLSYSMDYLNNQLPGVTKYDISNNDTVKRKADDLRQLFESINARVVDVSDAWSLFAEKGLVVLNRVLTDTDIANLNEQYYDLLTYFLIFFGPPFSKTRIADQIDSFRSKIDKLWEDFDLRNIIGTKDIELLETLQHVFDELDEYSNDHNMDELFYRQQFLQLDVFFKELRSEQIDQQRGYDAIALLCDIGGATGLFIGGSLITVFEIAEFLLMCLVCKVCFRKVKAT